MVLCISYYTAVWAAKGAFLAMYFHLGDALSKPMRLIVRIAIVYTGLAYVVMILITLLWCRPLSSIW
jgi:hypothetical protein